jgi:hypothetical protein
MVVVRKIEKQAAASSVDLTSLQLVILNPNTAIDFPFRSTLKDDDVTSCTMLMTLVLSQSLGGLRGARKTSTRILSRRGGRSNHHNSQQDRHRRP